MQSLSLYFADRDPRVKPEDDIGIGMRVIVGLDPTISVEDRITLSDIAERTISESG